MFDEWKKRHASQIEDYKFRLNLLTQSPLALFGLIVVIVLIVAAILAPWIAPYPGDGMMVSTHPERRLQPPSLEHLFGTDELGRDLLSRVIFGCWITLTIAIMVVATSAVIGVPLGLVAGYRGGMINELIMRATDIVMSIPPLVLAMLIVVSLAPSLENALIAISLTHWTRYTRIVQGVTLSAKEEPYVEAARAYNASDLRIIFKHIWPNIISPITVQASMDAGRAVLLASALSFIGLGARPPSSEWGLMISYARHFIPVFWWYPIFPGIAITIVVIGFSFLGDGLRDVMDPRLRR